ncbi:hypothetical protein NLX86_26345 [Streptomyces sp. A3M-1-3]|uniref:hypothetical protein n=1 Tax=Streptomyces sp. A3M-1-3 TaxID=2962044 RepID=UPI0020B76F83|nr:hypothetical protein [Streptomyces sp. A3M-1-3]MCP3821485.1 hypothetical protein [Streptomyces sp. A3M-1-3]
MSGLPLMDILRKAAHRDVELVAHALPDNVRAAGYVPLDVLLARGRCRSGPWTICTSASSRW